MLKSNYLQRLADTAGVKLLVVLMLVMSVLVNLAQGLNSLGGHRPEKTIFVPATLDKSFWIRGDEMSPEYIEQMGNYVCQLMLNVTPVSYEYQGRFLLAIADPRAYSTLRHRIALTGAILKRDSVSTFFEGRQVVTDAKKYPNRVAFSGNLVTMMSDKKVASFAKVFMVEVGMVAGKTVVVDFRETNERDPLGTEPVAAEVGLDDIANSATPSPAGAGPAAGAKK